MRVETVIPARNEEELVERCLASVTASYEEAGLEPRITLVADACSDRTVEIAQRFEGVHVLEVDGGNVGAARGAGVRWAIRRARAVTSGIWIANTDADSTVPLNWISLQRELAASGVDLMIGTVRPDFSDLRPAQIAAWAATHTIGEANGHVHGANLGIRASLYEISGGFPALAEHEDVDLVARCAPHTRTVVATDECEVVTSGRQYGRTPGGYAGYLRTELLPAT
jgi:glycosyltransferase involved in cell wall biosynthesis